MTEENTFVKSNFWLNPKVVSKSGKTHKCPKGLPLDKIFLDYPEDWFVRSLQKTFSEMAAKGVGKFDITLTVECVNRTLLNNSADDEPESLA